MDVRDAVEHLWPGRTASWEVLGEGLTRHNVRVTLDDGAAFVLRLADEGTAAVGIDRRGEREACLAAAAVGVGPVVETFVEPSGPLVTRWIDGDPVNGADLRRPETLRRVVAALRAFHGGPPLRRRFDAFTAVEELRSTAFARGVEIPQPYAWARQLARRVAEARGPAPERPCHNDLVCANLIDDGVRIRIVDWEVAGMGDVFLDLACLVVDAGLEPDERAELLTAYGRATSADRRSLELMRFMACYRNAMWGVVQGAIAGSAYDFDAYVADWFRELEAISGEPQFAAALGG